MTHFKQRLESYQKRNNQQLETWLNSLHSQDNNLIQAMRYGLLLGGKRARPFLVYATGSVFGLNDESLDTPASAIECIHAYSLIHDDLPAMDDDELRRGQATCHIEFDEATAILAGDALQTLAFSILAEGKLAPQAESYRIKMVQSLASASGASGMCLGQSLDLEAENRQVSLDELKLIHRNKTGALIKSAIQGRRRSTACPCSPGPAAPRRFPGPPRPRRRPPPAPARTRACRGPRRPPVRRPGA